MATADILNFENVNISGLNEDIWTKFGGTNTDQPGLNSTQLNCPISARN